MRTILRNWIPAGIVLFGFFALAGCGGGGGVGVAGGEGGLTPTGDTFNWTGNTPLTVVAASGLLGNDPAGSVIADPGVKATTLGGAVDVAANGAFTYDPPVGEQNVSDTFTYTVAGFAPVTVTINLDERIWFVDNTRPPGGNGTFGNPFNTLAQAETASDVDDTIFVFAGDRTDTGQDEGITLKAGQRLLGEGVGLRVGGFPLVDPFPNARISNANAALAGIPVVTLATGNEVAGFTIEATSDEGILAAGGTGFNLHDNTITLDPVDGREGIRLLDITGENFVNANDITGSPRDGIRLANNEDVAGNPVAATPIVATVTLSRNTISDSQRDGITANLEGAGTAVTLNILTNVITNSGIAGVDEGIDIDSLDAASVTAVISRNTVSQSTDEEIDLDAGTTLVTDTSSISAFVANNDLSLSGGGATDFLASTVAGSTATFCLELENNVSTAGVPSTFQVENNGEEVFQFFEGVNNDTVANQVGIITPTVQGGCGIVLDGAALFEANCAICHTGNGLGFGNVGPDITNRTAAEINFQLINNPSMNNIRLTGREVDAIAGALAAGP